MSIAAPVIHIESSPDKCGGKPCVAGTRIRVWDIHVWHDLRGQSPEQIVATFPQLSVADVHAALTHFLDHRQEIEQQMMATDKFAMAVEQAQGPTKFSRVRDQMNPGA